MPLKHVKEVLSFLEGWEWDFPIPSRHTYAIDIVIGKKYLSLCSKFCFKGTGRFLYNKIDFTICTFYCIYQTS